MNKELVIKFYTDQELVTEIKKRIFNDQKRMEITALADLYLIAGKITAEYPDLYLAIVKEVKQRKKEWKE